MKARQARIQLLVRENIRRQRMGGFLASASEIIGETIRPTSVLNIDATDFAAERLRAAYLDTPNALRNSGRFLESMRETGCSLSSIASQSKHWTGDPFGSPVQRENRLQSRYS